MSKLFELAENQLASRSSASLRPLCVDLEGALIKGSLLLESLASLIKRNPLYILWIAFWLTRGRYNLEAEVARRTTPSPPALAYDIELLEWLRAERARGRSVWLCSRSSSAQATGIAAYVKIFDGVLTARANAEGSLAMAKLLVERFGVGGFEYCNSARHSKELWSHMVRALRPHQWVKNTLLLVPLLTSHRVSDLVSVTQAVTAMFAFCLCASSVYMVNDICDLEADRAHARKSKRPFASGDLSLAWGFVMAPCLLALASMLASTLPQRFEIVLGVYYLLTVAYSLVLKKIVVLDTLTLSGLYTLRIIAGAAAISVALSFWLLSFSVFLFLSLAYVKRYAELTALRRQQQLRASGRDYETDDVALLQSMGSASGYLSVLVLALYINSPDVEVLYHRPQALWILCVLTLYWISRAWMKARRGEMDEDPVIFALRDRTSLLIGLLAAVAIVLAM